MHPWALTFTGQPKGYLPSLTIYTRRNGNSVAGTIQFAAIAATHPLEATSEEVARWQGLAGYPAPGYGGSTIAQLELLPGLWLYTWTCFASCD